MNSLRIVFRRSFYSGSCGRERFFTETEEHREYIKEVMKKYEEKEKTKKRKRKENVSGNCHRKMR